MSVTCPTCDEEFDPPRSRGRVECPRCGSEFTPRRSRSRDESGDGSGMFVGVMLGLLGLIALGVGAGFFLFTRPADRPAPPEVVQAAPPQVHPAPLQQTPPRNGQPPRPVIEPPQ